MLIEAAALSLVEVNCSTEVPVRKFFHCFQRRAEPCRIFCKTENAKHCTIFLKLLHIIDPTLKYQSEKAVTGTWQNYLIQRSEY